MFKNRICCVCRRPVPERRGVNHFHIPALPHQGRCDAIVSALAKDYSRSPRGRFRKGAAHRKAIEEAVRDDPTLLLMTPEQVLETLALSSQLPAGNILSAVESSMRPGGPSRF
jgi:hypothetical protein